MNSLLRQNWDKNGEEQESREESRVNHTLIKLVYREIAQFPIRMDPHPGMFRGLWYLL